jgi:heptosyltransferase II
MKIDKSLVKRILVITLSNAGDIIMTTPVIRVLRREFPDSRLDVMVGPTGEEIFNKDPDIFKLIIYDKHMSIIDKRRLQLKLKNVRYDLVVDIRNTVFPLLIGPKFRTATIQRFPSSMVHMMKRHLYRLRSLGIGALDERPYIHIPKEDDEYVSALLKDEGIIRPMVVVNAGAKSHLKRWMTEAFAAVADRLIGECGVDVIFVGLQQDAAVVDGIISKMKKMPRNFVNRTNIRQLAGLLKCAKLLITNDSAPLHLGCAVGTRVLSIFGPTDPHKYGPTGKGDRFIAANLPCSPCESAVCKYDYECMKSISAEAVFDIAREMIKNDA